MAKATPQENGETSEQPQPVLPSVSGNPALLDWPQDPWGFTSEFRKAGLKAAGRVKGDPEKLAVFMAMLRTLALHSQARVEGDAKDRAERGARIEAAALLRREHLFCARPQS